MAIWFILFAAIIFEVFGTTALKLSDGFTRLVPTFCVFIFYGLGLFLLTLTLKKLDLGVVYAIWSGLGTAIVAVIGIIFFKDTLNTFRVISLLMIIVGVICLQISSNSNPHL